MSNYLRGLPALAEDLSCFLSTHIRPKYLKIPLQGIHRPLVGFVGTALMCTHIQFKINHFPFYEIKFSYSTFLLCFPSINSSQSLPKILPTQLCILSLSL